MATAPPTSRGLHWKGKPIPDSIARTTPPRASGHVDYSDYISGDLHTSDLRRRHPDPWYRPAPNSYRPGRPSLRKWPSEELHHWADIECQTTYGQDDDDYEPRPRSLTITVIGHLDYTVLGSPPDFDGHLSTTLDPPDQYELFVAEGAPYEYSYLHKRPASPLQIVSKRGGENNADVGEWYRTAKPMVEHSLNPVQLFVLTDEEQNLRDIKVVKPLGINKDEKNDDWGKSNDPRELFLNKIVLKVTDADDTLTKMVHHSYHHSMIRSKEPLVHYLYFDYRKLGSLDSLWRLHQQQSRRSAQDQIASPYLPESFLWLVFYNLAEACDGQEGFMQVDIKPQNILLGAPKHSLKSFPHPQLADLELYYRTGVEYMFTDEYQKGTPGWQAPEQIINDGLFVNENVRTDVWQIGLVIFGLMRNADGHGWFAGKWGEEANVEPNDVENEMKRSDEGLKYDGLYSHRLENLVTECLQQDCLKRPRITNLRDRASNGLFHETQKYDAYVSKAKQTGSGIPSELEVPLLKDHFLRDKPYKGHLQGHVYGKRKPRRNINPYLPIGGNPVDAKLEAKDVRLVRERNDWQEPAKSPRNVAAPARPAYGGGAWGGHPVGSWKPYPGGGRKRKRAAG
ncbi:hypothetical protein P280DRAFT_482875 [Massarina eburnea CBS 473.64]|uniref:Protein kinase domain-containing protein n=1 Tax=Massarina eburnea CBS 473.64 TaxID=1395130 RepID=A0A6A6RSS1_9PLEO|nr:hypothetical protein P280DRAFT_482875 [Massarina eburnea CBS 473.64]